MAIGVALGTVWEGLEFGYDHIVAPGNAIKGKVDTLADLAADAAGALGAALYSRRRLH